MLSSHANAIGANHSQFYYKDGMPYMVPEECLPLELPAIDKFEPTETGEPPLGTS